MMHFASGKLIVKLLPLMMRKVNQPSCLCNACTGWDSISLWLYFSSSVKGVGISGSVLNLPGFWCQGPVSCGFAHCWQPLILRRLHAHHATQPLTLTIEPSTYYRRGAAMLLTSVAYNTIPIDHNISVTPERWFSNSFASAAMMHMHHKYLVLVIKEELHCILFRCQQLSTSANHSRRETYNPNEGGGYLK